ncbi:hypothetical protein CaldiYA01_12350 [Caldicellulosiruptor diazotrophicus]|uniref:Uncharacterized protein n=1 Tax=Caldicellulosiruptor diazotrophicus TaxID=2806205 RepID=A0ABN6E773_9FIRM|nr:hypothetical protein CaldiYA01_12350 [Caldicellulosiruptor diazotrophicus]
MGVVKSNKYSHTGKVPYAIINESDVPIKEFAEVINTSAPFILNTSSADKTKSAEIKLAKNP